MTLPIVFGSDPALVGMKLWLPINEGAGSRFNNLIDSQNPGLMTGGTWSGGKPTLDGADDLITLRRVPIEDFTAIIHYTPTGVSGISPVFDQGDILIRQSDDDIIYGATDTLNTDSTDTLTAVLTAGEPIAIAVTRSGTTMTIWGFTQSGVATDSFTVSGTPLTTNANLVIGSDSRESFVFVDLAPANLTAEKAIVINANDVLEISTGSVSLNSAVVTENWNGNQLTVLMWVKLPFVPGDGLTHQLLSNNVGGGNGIAAFIFTDGVLYYDVTDKDTLLHRFSSSITGWAAGEWHQVVLRLDFKNDQAELYVDGVSVDSTPTNPFSGDSIDAIESDTDIGHAAGALQLNGSTTLLIEGSSWSNAEITANYAAGAGTPFVVSPDTLALGDYSNDGTGIVYHPGQIKINSISTVTLTLSEAADTKLVAGDKVVVYDDSNPANAVHTVVATVSGATVTVDDSCAAVNGTNKTITRNRWVDGNQESTSIGNVSVGANQAFTKDTTTVERDSRSGKLEWTAADDNDESAIAVITSENDEELAYGFWIYFASIDGSSNLFIDFDGSATPIHTRQLDTGTDDRGTSYATGTWLYYEGSFKADQAAITVRLRITGAGAGANAAVIYLDQGEIANNMVAQGGCEAADGNALPTGWSDTGSPAADETQTDDAEQHSGATSILLNNCDADEGVTQDITVIVGEYYTFSVWEKNNAQDVNAVLSGAATATIDITGDNSWTKHSYSFKATTTTLTIKVTSGAANQSTWVDDFVVERNDTQAATTADRLRSFADGKAASVAVWDRAMTFEEVQEMARTYS